MHNWIAGEEITADKLNQLNPETGARLSQTEHNILELYLENYFASKNTPFQGLFFDGFSDTNKADVKSSQLTAAINAGDAVFSCQSIQNSPFAVGDVIQIYDDARQEIKTITAVGSGSGESLPSPYSYYDDFEDGSIDANKWTPTGNVSESGGKITITGNNGANNIVGKANWGLSKAFKFNANVPRTVMSGHALGLNNGVKSLGFGNSWNVNGNIHIYNAGEDFDTGIGAGGTIREFIITRGDDGTTKYYIDGVLRYTGSAKVTDLDMKLTFSNFYDSGMTCQILDVSTATIGLPVSLTVTPAFAGPVALTGNVSACSGTIDTGNKKLAMTAGIGDLKKVLYTSKKQSFFQPMHSAKLWIMRAVPARFNPAATLANGDAQATIRNLSVKNKFAVGDTIEISDSVNRERKTVTAVLEAVGAVTVDVSGAVNGSNSTITIPDKSSQNQILIVKVGHSNWIFRGSQNIASVTANGQALTLAGSQRDGSASGVQISIWYLKNPPTGSVTIDVQNSYPGYGSIGFTWESVYNAQAVESYSNAMSGNGITYSDNNANDLISGIACLTGNPSWNVNSPGVADGGSFWSGDTNTGFHGSHRGGANGSVTLSYGNGLWMMNAVIVKQSMPQAVLTFTPAIQKSEGFNIAANIDRVDALPLISLAAKGAHNEFQSPEFIESVENILTGNELMVEDEYDYRPSDGGNDLTVQLIITRSDPTTSPYAKNLGVSLNA